MWGSFRFIGKRLHGTMKKKEKGRKVPPLYSLAAIYSFGTF
jgi:hypothetical protein